MGCKRLRTRIATDLCVWVLGSLKLTTTGTKSCLLLRLQTALKSDEGDLRKWGVSNTESTIRFSKFKATGTVPDFSPRPTNSNGLLVSFLTKTSHIEIHDEAPVSVASLFFKILQTNHWFTDVSFVRFKSYLKDLNHERENKSSCTPHPSRWLQFIKACTPPAHMVNMR